MFKLYILVLLFLFSGTILAQQEEEFVYCTISEETTITTETDNLLITLNGIGEITLTTFEVAIGTVSSNVNLRVSPSTSALVASVLSANSTVEVIGRNSASNWLRVNDEEPTWIFANLVNDLTIEINDLPIISSRNDAIPFLLEYFIDDENDCQAFLLIQSIEETQVIVDDITYVLSPETVLVWVNDETTLFYVVDGDTVVVSGNEVFYIPEGAKLSKVTSNADNITYEEAPYSDADVTAFGLSDEIIVADPIDEDALRSFIIQSRPAPAAPVVTQDTQTNTTETDDDTTTAPPPPTSGLVGRRVVSNFSTGFSITSIPGAGSEAVIGQVPVGTGGLVIESSFVGCCNFINVQWDTGQIGWVYDQWVALEE